MPVAMLSGGIFYEYTSLLSGITPYLIGIMLFFTYSNLSFLHMKISRMHLWLLAIQIMVSISLYLLLAPVNLLLAQAAMICVFAPTATSAPVIAGMLGGNIESLTTYSFISNMIVAVMAPFVFAFAGNIDAHSFFHSILIISERVLVLLLLPLACALILKNVFPPVHLRIKKMQGLSFYLWSLALVIVTGKTVKFIIDEGSGNLWIELSIALVSLSICVSQFFIGRRIGRKYDDTVAGGQGLGQKNTVLAIWMAQTYLNPIASIGPGSYVLWQNMVNSYQVWRKRKSL